MARLGLRHPEIFRCLGQVVRRSGLWSFADNEVLYREGSICFGTSFLFPPKMLQLLIMLLQSAIRRRTLGIFGLQQSHLAFHRPDLSGT